MPRCSFAVRILPEHVLDFATGLAHRHVHVEKCQNGWHLCANQHFNSLTTRRYYNSDGAVALGTGWHVAAAVAKERQGAHQACGRLLEGA